MSERANPLTPFLEAHQALHDNAPAWLVALREHAMQQASTLGLPSTKNEEWKYTNVAPIVKLVQGHAIGRIGQISPTTLAELQGRTYCETTNRLVFVNGAWSKTLSTSIDPRVHVLPIAAALESHGTLIREHLAAIASIENNTFAALNTALLHDAAVVVVPVGVSISEPIQLLFVSQSQNGGGAVYPRVLIVAEKGSRACIIESHVSSSPDTYFSNSVAEVLVDEDATLEHYRIQDDSPNAFHISTCAVLQRARSTYRSCVVTTGGALTRNALHAALSGEGIRCELDGLYLVDGKRHVDNHTEIDHSHPRCESVQMYKGILAGESRGVFNGKVFVRKDAQQTNAQQSNRNLILSDHARVDTKPQLEILADDVKCTHGATIGQLDEASLFYLKTRGIGEELGRRLLTYGFAYEILERITIAGLREHLDRSLARGLEPKHA